MTAVGPFASPGPWRRSTIGPVVALAAFYLLFTVMALLRHDGDPAWFLWLGSRYSELNPAGTIGYDGQFVFYIARDGFAAQPHLDIPAYRLQRILLPALARLFSAGSPALINWFLITANALFILAGAGVLARWLKQRGLSPWLALIYGLHVGTMMAFSRALTEPLAYLLVILGIAAWLDGRDRRAWLWLALAPLAKETTFLFPAALALAAIMQRRPRRALWALSSLLPLVAWQFYLALRLGQIPFGAGSRPTYFPLAGILRQLTLEPGRLSAFLWVGLPAVFLTIIALWQLRRRAVSAPLWLLAGQAGFLLFLGPDVYDHLMHAGRNSLGLIVALIFCLPLLPTQWARLAALFWLPATVIWLLPTLRWVVT